MENPEQILIVWSDYIKYRIDLRGFDHKKVETILRYSDERYFDNVTQRRIVIGSHDRLLVMIPYEIEEGNIISVTIHVTTRQQLNHYGLKVHRLLNSDWKSLRLLFQFKTFKKIFNTETPE